jgi:hypothetical protein
VVSAVITIAGSTTRVQAGPKVLIHLNQITASEAARSASLRAADGVFLLASNSPDLTHSALAQVVKNIRGIIVSEDGGISPTHLMQRVLVPRVKLITPEGRSVLARANSNLQIGDAAADDYQEDLLRWYWTRLDAGGAPALPRLSETITSGAEIGLLSESDLWIQADLGAIAR